MRVLDALLGNASEVDIGAVGSALANVLVEGEEVRYAYRLLRDPIIVTHHRLILLDKHGLSGRKQEVSSIPFAPVTRFSKENEGRLNRDAELRVWIRGEAGPLTFTFRHHRSVDDIYLVLSRAVLLG